MDAIFFVVVAEMLNRQRVSAKRTRKIKITTPFHRIRSAVHSYMTIINDVQLDAVSIIFRCANEMNTVNGGLILICASRQILYAISQHDCQSVNVSFACILCCSFLFFSLFRFVSLSLLKLLLMFRWVIFFIRCAVFFVSYFQMIIVHNLLFVHIENVVWFVVWQISKSVITKKKNGFLFVCFAFTIFHRWIIHCGRAPFFLLLLDGMGMKMIQNEQQKIQNHFYDRGRDDEWKMLAKVLCDLFYWDPFYCIL